MSRMCAKHQKLGHCGATQQTKEFATSHDAQVSLSNTLPRRVRTSTTPNFCCFAFLVATTSQRHMKGATVLDGSNP